MITRYTLREIVPPTLATLFVTTFLLLTTQLLRVGEAAFGYGLTALDFLSILALLLPRFLVFTLPISALVGVIAGLGRLADDREVLAVEAAGRSPASLWPGPVILGAVMSLATLGLTTEGEPASLRALSQRLTYVVEKNLAEGLVPGVIHDEIPGLMLHAQGRGPGGELAGVLMQLTQLDATVTLVARRARLLPTGARGLLLSVEDGEILEAGGEDPTGPPVLSRVRFQRGEVAIDVERTFHRRVRFVGDLDVLGLAELRAEGLAASDARRRRKVQSLYHRRFATGAACLLFALLAVPLALWNAGARKSGRGLMVLLGIGVVAGYYVLMRLGDGMAVAGSGSPLLWAWMPNLVTAALAGALLWRGVR